MSNQIINFPIKGIERNKPIHSTDEGAAQEVINLRPLNGAWRNIGEKEQIAEFYSDRLFAALNADPYFFPVFYRHPSLPAKCYVSYWEDTKTIEFYAFCEPTTFNPNWNNNSGNWVLNDWFWDDNSTWIDTANVWSDSNSIFTIPNGETFKCFAHLNNVLMVVTNVNRYFFLWKQSDLTYVALDDLPNSFMKLKSNLIPSTTFNYTTGNATIAYNYLMGEYYKYIAEKKQIGYWEGHTFFCAAYKLYDNTYIPCTEILYHNCGLDSYDNDQRLRVIYIPTVFQMENVNVESPGFSLTLTQSNLNIINIYKDLGIIKSIVLLSSREFTQYDFGTSFVDWFAVVSAPIRYYPKVPSDFSKMFDNIINFYNIYEIDNFVLSQDYYPFVDKKINIDEIETYEHVTFDQFVNTKYIAESYFNYNERLHLANITNVLGNGFNLFEKNSNHISDYYEGLDYILSNPFTLYRLYVEVELNINTDKKYLRFDVSDYVDVYENTSSDMFVFLHQFITFPDYRASKIRILFKHISSDIFYIAKYGYNGVVSNAVFALKHNTENNISYYSEYLTIDTANPIPFKLFVLVLNNSWSDITTYLTLYSHPAIDNIYTDTNRVQVSEQNNIFVYPAKNSYRFAEIDNVVIGMQTVAEELSATRFGQFPLYIFTKQGVYSLEQGTGEVLYSNISPLDYSPCINPDLICSINGAVVFATASGLKIIFGRQVVEISQAIEELVNDNPLLTNPHYLSVINSDATVRLYNVINKIVTFVSEINKYKSAYDRELKELFITNPIKATGNPAARRLPPRSDYDYSFIFHKESKQWYKFQTKIVNFINNFYGFSSLNYDGLLLSINNLENETNSSLTYSQCLYQSRPFSLKTLSFKKLEHIATRIFARLTNYIVSAIEEEVAEYIYAPKHLSVYIFGSVDNSEYKLVGGGHSQTTIVTDILHRRTYASCRYFIVVITVHAKDVILNKIDFELVMKFADKIR